MHGDRAFASGQGALSADGSLSETIGQVPTEVSLERRSKPRPEPRCQCCRRCARALGDLDRIAAWLTLTGFVNAAPEFPSTTLVLNPASELILDIFGPAIGAHARTAVGYSTLPFRMPVVISAELAIHP